MRILTHTIEPRDDGRRLGRVIASRFSISVHLLRTLKAQNGILLDGASAHTDRVVRTGQIITLLVERDGPEKAGDPSALRVPYIDADILIADKDAPLPTLPSRHQNGETLREQVMRYLGETEPYTFRPVNRLDKGTSGLMVVARNAHAQQLASRALHSDAFVRAYLAVTQGVPAQMEGMIDAPIARVPGEAVRRCVAEGGQEACTQYRVLKTGNGRALLYLRLFTGRTHQIRVHLSHLGCPIVGDYLYGQEEESLPGRFALHSAYLSLAQPVTGERIEIESPLPQALARLMNENGNENEIKSFLYAGARAAHAMRGVMSMSREYRDLHALLQAEEAARTFFMKQPEHVQGGVLQQAFAIHSLRGLEDTARSMRRTVE